ncbi:ADP-ribosyl cyclase/cyclic ADP-ribose hydrolase [Citrus sinensis]|uniref:ADP-ribosyl cyclase/cyclic ADP-ribose hydrolase n=1 Tax=Citrus sinensis TaxID=2711 RepID=A0ACB8M8L2_CITSI|nr:ADP-ribosyl cyclase/cyclic ADP-ribose hydrolase [Citrus sinensis]
MSIHKVSPFVPYPLPHWKYDVFLSFRGVDTRKNFTDHLYTALDQKGIIVFRDDKELERGESISPGLFKAIEESKISIIVFSRNYACSTWCLDELVHILECKNKNHQQMVYPIFYDVEPTDVRKQTGILEEVFARHEEILAQNKEKVQKWRDALKEVANICGWELKERNQSEFILEVVKVISSKSPIISGILKNLVGIDSHLKNLRLLMDKGSNDVRMIGICGMGGIGKTTLARVVYDLTSHKFEGSSFLANVREISKEGGLISLQKQLLSQLLKLPNNGIWNVYDGINIIGSRLHHKKVLLLIDDVVDIKQLECLAGKREWFGPGSRIIITSRDKHLLMTHGVDEVYKLRELHDDNALQLFCKKAFKTHQPKKGYEQLSEWVTKYSGGLPLALKVLGSFLYGKTKKEWQSAVKRLKRDSENEILDILQISFDGLKETEKKIFLDIACFHRGENRDYVTKILDYCDFDPVIGIRVLVDKSLIEVLSNNQLWMHDLLREMGQQIVKRQCPEDPGKRSRLWKEADVRQLLTRNTGSETVEVIYLNFPAEAEVHFGASSNTFLKMTNLRMLLIRNVQVQLPEGLEYLSNELRLLEWTGYPLKSLPSNFQPDKIVELNMCYSYIEQMWNGIKPLSNLKFMRLGKSKNLIRTPDFSGMPYLEELDLGGCTRLCDIHPTLLLHKKIILLNLKDCTSLTTLPGKISMESLKILVLSGCMKLKNFPEIVGSMKCLSDLLLDGTDIKELPILPFELLSGLVQLNVEGCNKLERLPRNISALKYHPTWNLSGLLKFSNFPEIMTNMEHVLELHLEGTAIRGLPISIELFSGLVLLNLRDCKNLLSLPCTINGLKSLKKLYLSGCSNLKNVPENLGKVESLEVLELSGCKGPPVSSSWYLPFPISLKRSCSDPTALRLPSLSEELYLSKNSFVTAPASINRLFNLEELELEDCKRLQSMPQLPPNIKEVGVNGCASLEKLSDALKLCKSENISISCIDNLKLLSNDGLAFSMLKEYLEAVSRPMQKFGIVVPGSEIPEWFMHQNDGSSIKFIMPSNLYCKNKALGYAVCCVFHVREHSPGIQTRRSYPTHQLNCQMKGSSTSYSIEFREKFAQAESGHLWLLYLSLKKCYYSNWCFDNNLIELSFRPVSGSGLQSLQSMMEEHDKAGGLACSLVYQLRISYAELSSWL